MIRDDVSGKRVRHEVSETATAGELLQEACTRFGREELDSALEVDGAVVCTGVVGGVSGGEASVGSLGVHSDSSLVLCRSRDRVLAEVAGWNCLVESEDSLPEWAWDDEVVALAAAACGIVFVSERLRSSDSFMRDAVKQNGFALRSASVEFQSDKALVLAAVTSRGCSLKYANETLRADKQVVMTAVANNCWSLKYASETLKADREVVMTAVAANGDSLEYASESLRADREVVMTAVAASGYSLEYASESLRAARGAAAAAAAAVAAAAAATAAAHLRGNHGGGRSKGGAGLGLDRRCFGTAGSGTHAGSYQAGTAGVRGGEAAAGTVAGRMGSGKTAMPSLGRASIQSGTQKGGDRRSGVPVDQRRGRPGRFPARRRTNCLHGEDGGEVAVGRRTVSGELDLGGGSRSSEKERMATSVPGGCDTQIPLLYRGSTRPRTARRSEAGRRGGT